MINQNRENNTQNRVNTVNTTENQQERIISLEDLIIETQINGWILQAYRQLFKRIAA